MIRFTTLGILTCTSTVTARTFTVVNSCSYTVWYGLSSGSCACLLTPMSYARWQQEPKDIVSFTVPDGWTGHIWGRRDCNFTLTNGSNSCLDGGCEGGLECNGTGVPPVTIAEFSLDADQQDFYDVSLVNGFNIPVRITNSEDCAVADCPVDLNANCPAELAGPYDASGNAVGCKSACVAGLGDPVNNPNCCTGTHDTPATCPPTGVEYYSYFKGNCPDAQTYVYDISTSVLPCESAPQADYTITFCP
ncbi:thaumatin-like protein [Trametes punicea]|nr:thaumatin-like protein [Trametes punicea]